MTHWPLTLAFLLAAILLTAFAGVVIWDPDALPEALHGHPVAPTGDWMTDTVETAFSWFPALIALIFWGLFLTTFFSCG